jgi:hypothetical protein
MLPFRGWGCALNLCPSDLHFRRHQSQLGEQVHVVGFEPVLHDAAVLQAVDHDKGELHDPARGGDTVEVARVAAPEAGAQHYFFTGINKIIHPNAVAGEALFKNGHVIKGVLVFGGRQQRGPGDLFAGDGILVKSVQESSVWHVLKF